jgi:hypothetical protein
MASDVGTPALLLFSPSFENDLHSGPDSSTLSVITNPHLPQKFSPVFASVTSVPWPHLGHLSFGLIVLTIFSLKTFYDDI